MATLQQLKKVAAKYGATIYQTGNGDLEINAPLKKVWTCDDLHSLVVVLSQWGFKEKKSIAYDDAINRMRNGLRNCSDPYCDNCS